MSTKKRKSFLGGLSSPRHPPMSSAGGLPTPTTATFQAQRTASNPIKAAFSDLIPRGRRFFSAEFWRRKKEEETLQQRPSLSQCPPPPAPTEGRRPSTALPPTLRPPPLHTPHAPEREVEQNDDWETQSDTAYESLRTSPRTERARADDVFAPPVDAPRSSKVWGKAHRATKSLVPPRLAFVSETPPSRGTSAEESLEVLLARKEELRPPIPVLGEEMWNASAPNLSPERRVDKRSSTATIRHDTLPPPAFGVSNEFVRRPSTASTIKPMAIPTPITTSITKEEYSSSVSSNAMTPSTLAQDRESDSDISDWDASASEDEDSSTLKPSLPTRSEYAGMLRGGGHERAKSTSFVEGGSGTGSFSTAGESWDEDFDIAPSSPLSGQSESEEEDSITLQQPRRPMTARSTTIPGDRASRASGKGGRGSVRFSVPTSIVERQASIRGHLTNVKEFAKLVEELKTLLARHAYRDDEEGEDGVLWAEAEAVLDFASTDPETSTPRPRPRPRPRTSPPSLSSSTTSVATSTTTTPDIPLGFSHEGAEGGKDSRRIRMDARSVMGKVRGRAYTVDESVHVDTETLPGLVEYVRGLRERLVVSLGEA
ncbi:hypothetical protein SAICODRAFT_27317 [Saitoella complicata NRRL Y-17804]|uniref:Uncharacterized protein n=1 Tax=Saitoella complicata (strain BCRC 22490 / CBS 7301 / JCM 7358 / NBRC 10748 / NRRL Y-17804) TaxID=698492 RepID=A0A0E9NQS9_SAICN|nr:uncharacterized protein SAICODRAFT_27317 [Saitoella complicata NRRL Y-17804]ODQ50645.1 hypothetical protein SAICODRAFT_27317 [Saitoella complicata NRRL Y-17804]GAO52153.1 hypothetical protein G7K_6239-t1 [Saitoella complicata NRRL Y-17804]